MAAAQNSLAADSQFEVKADSTPLSLGEKLDDLGLLYENEQNSVMQELWVLGRYHGQYYFIDGNETDDNDFETRRMRLGLQSRMFEKMTVHAQMVSGSNVSPFYNGFTELWTQWSFSPSFALTVGQQKHRFTHDRNVSSRYLNYLERSMLTNMFGADYTPAVTAQGKLDSLTYYTGIFSNATGKNMEEAFLDLNSGYSYMAAAYYDLGTSFGADNVTLYGSYLYSDANEKATNLSRYNHGAAAALILTKDSASLVTEITGGFDSDQGNAVGFNLQPGYFLTDNLQLVGRYQLALSNDAEGLSPQRRYEREIDLPAGDDYHALYGGLNHYIAKHRLKLMSGVEYSQIGGEEAWTVSGMLRFYFGPHSGGAFPMNRMLDGVFEVD